MLCCVGGMWRAWVNRGDGSVGRERVWLAGHAWFSLSLILEGGAGRVGRLSRCRFWRGSDGEVRLERDVDV